MLIPKLETLEQYNVPTPRYTSYPTALSFNDKVDAAAVNTRLMGQDNKDRPLSVYFHLPFCRSLCWYCACTKVITKDQEKSAEYLARLLREFDMRLPWFESQPLVQLHLGGGTPTFLTPDELRALGDHVNKALTSTADSEWSVEIDPRELTEEHVKALVDVGFNRASLGVQDHDPHVQKVIHREQPKELTEQALGWLRDAGISSVNMDLIYGLPAQSAESFDDTISDVLAQNPDRLAIYSYAHVPWFAPAQKHLERFGLPTPSEKIRLFVNAVRRITEAGYVYIGMDHFAKPHDGLSEALKEHTLHRNFQGYSTRKGTDIHAFGMSAISQTRDMYFQNEKELSAWEETIDSGKIPIIRGKVLSADDAIRREVIMSIMCSAELDAAELSDTLGIDFNSYFEKELKTLSEFAVNEFIDLSDGGLGITEIGRFFVRNIARVFDNASAGTGFSKAI